MNNYEKHEIFGPHARLINNSGNSLWNTLCDTVSGTITIEKDAFFGFNVMLLAGTHDINKTGKDRANSVPTTGCDIVIGEGVWVASGAIILGPCDIGKNSVVAAGAVVTSGKYPENSVLMGVPAKNVKSINIKKEMN